MVVFVCSQKECKFYAVEGRRRREEDEAFGCLIWCFAGIVVLYSLLRFSSHDLPKAFSLANLSREFLSRENNVEHDVCDASNYH